MAQHPQQTITKQHFQVLLERARARLRATTSNAAENLVEEMENRNVTNVNLTLSGAGNESTEEERQEVVDSLLDALSGSNRGKKGEASNASTEHQLLHQLRQAEDARTALQQFTETNTANDGNTNTTTEDAIDVGVLRAGTTQLLQEAQELSARKVIGVARDDITLNGKQASFADLVESGEDCILIGAAGTGKTTTMRSVTRRLMSSSMLTPIVMATKHLLIGKPGAAIVSFTRKAVNNIRHAVIEELKAHVLTIHKLLEYAPEFYEIEDPNNPGIFKNTMRFVPTRNKHNPLPQELTFLAFEESSMISTELYQLLQEAMPHKHQEVFLGDIQQLPPIFGQAILGFKMLQLPVVELTEVYRQAKESPIIDLAWKILSGDSNIFSPKTESYNFTTATGKKVSRIRVPALDAFSREVILENGETTSVKFQPWQKSLNVDYGNLTAIKTFCEWENAGYYNAEEDIILCPFNKGVGTLELNKGISDYLGKKRGAEVYEIISGFNKQYLAVGDRVLYDKEDAIITKIARNGKYFGRSPMPSSTKLDRWGHLDTTALTDADRLQLMHKSQEDAEMDMEAIEAFMAAANEGTAEDRVQSASHVIELRYAYQDEFDTPVVLESAGELNNLLGGYCITVHKFQGSEAERVFLLFHNTHATMIQRELLYTAVTRAKKFLHIICERDTFFKGVKSQKIKGNTIAEKAEWFKGKQASLPSAQQPQQALKLVETEEGNNSNGK